MDAGGRLRAAVSLTVRDPVNRGGRFSTKAVTPSMKSGERPARLDRGLQLELASMRANCQALSWRLVPA